MSTTGRTFRGRSAHERRAERQARLLEAALDLVGERGWARLSMTAICRRAGLTERYFYESYPNLGALQRDLLDRVAAEARDVALAALAQDHDHTADRLRAVLHGLLALLIGDPRKGQVALMDGLSDGELQLRRREILRGFEQLLIDHAATLIAPGGDPAHTELMAATLVGATDEIFCRRLLGTLSATDEQLVDHLVGLALGGTPLAAG